MGIGDRGIALQHLKTLFSVGMIGGLTDAQLLERFTSHRDETAELAFRAWSSATGRWCSASAAACSTTLTTPSRPRSWSWCAGPAHFGCGTRWGPGFILPERYREAVVLCLLEGLTPEQVARYLNCPVGTVHSRLAGKEHPGKAAGSSWFRGRFRSGGDCRWRSIGLRVLRTGGFNGNGRTFVSGRGSGGQSSLSARINTLTQRVLQSMALTTVKSAIAMLLALGIAVLGAGGLISRTLATDTQEKVQANPDDLRERVLELKQELQQMQKDIAKLEQETQPGRNDRNTCDTTFLANRFKYRVPFETGLTQSTEGGRIEIREVWGTRPRIEIGGQYLVRGKYVLPAGERGMLYFYATAGGAWGQTASLDLQSTAVDKQEGEFALIHGMAGPGHFHLILTAAERYSRQFANVYFGTGDNVWREQP